MFYTRTGREILYEHIINSFTIVLKNTEVFTFNISMSSILYIIVYTSSQCCFGFKPINKIISRRTPAVLNKKPTAAVKLAPQTF